MCRKHKNRTRQLDCVLAITFWQWQRFIKNEILRKWIPCLCIIEASITHLLFYNFQPLHSKIPSFIGDKSVNLSWKELTKPSVPSTTIQAGYERCLILVFDSIFFFLLKTLASLKWSWLIKKEKEWNVFVPLSFFQMFRCQP
jgi:hypothetical protein